MLMPPVGQVRFIYEILETSLRRVCLKLNLQDINKRFLYFSDRLVFIYTFDRKLLRPLRGGGARGGDKHVCDGVNVSLQWPVPL